ncbi:hypothetical protein TCDM_09300 [Trypanosoma cruzi Dm28c]|uniref:Uncharacterized protein n=1 Tax=Trypanosoma cruzi Dm28c TaxID=1416333 RepID=V5BA76_TRYCR|nr:hypothetical protein TCDM_09300 [Trypanosoma cruzi Dm28c]
MRKLPLGEAFGAKVLLNAQPLAHSQSVCTFRKQMVQCFLRADCCPCGGWLVPAVAVIASWHCCCGADQRLVSVRGDICAVRCFFYVGRTVSQQSRWRAFRMKAPTVTDVVCLSHQCCVTVRAFLLPTACEGPSLHRRCVGLPCRRGNSFRPGAVGSSLKRMKAECSGEMLQKRRWLVQSFTVQYRRPLSSDSPHPSRAVCICSCWSRASRVIRCLPPGSDGLAPPSR